MAAKKAAIKLVGDWKKASAILATSDKDIQEAATKALLAEGEYIVGEIKKRFKKVLPANAPSTILQKGSNKPLIDDADYKNSVKAIPSSSSKGIPNITIGIPRSDKKATKLYLIHEFGKIIVQRITPAQRKFMHALLSKLGPGGAKGSGAAILVIHIPARPVFTPVFEEERPKMPDRFLARMLKNLKGKLGSP